ncbi:MAG: tRNA uracil 4-sulfurtransferase ThiI [Longimicrobiales bacterium]
MSDLILVRLAAELTIKSSRTRVSFMRRLTRNMRDALKSADVEHRIETQWGRVYVRADHALALPVLSRVFGLSSISAVDRRVHADVDTIVENAVELYRDVVRGQRFAVRARRVGKHAFASKDVEIKLGSALLPFSNGVDLSAPDVTVHVEIRGDRADLFCDRVRGAGGLPVGVEGRAVSLLSGGYDSAVSSWLMIKRGIALDYVFCNLGGDAYERAVLQVAKVLADEWSFGTRPRMHVIDFTEPLRDLRENIKEGYWQLALKRLMYHAASQVATESGAQAIITGEAVGQVSSQTLTNLRVLDPAATLPLFRPLLGFDKDEIIGRARLIGTASLSEQVKEYCAITPGRPITASKMDRLDAEEAKLDPALLDAAVAARKVLDLRDIKPADMVAPYLFTEDVPDGAHIIDCRPLAQFRGWHLKGAERRDEWELLRDFKKLDRNVTYVLYCAHGIQTAYIAEKMQRAGYEAYSFRGGLRGVMAYAKKQGLHLELLR